MPARTWASPLLAALATALVPINAAAQVERTSRDGWQRVEDVFAALEVDEGDWIADVGAGSGFFSLRLSPRVGPEGRVIAQDIDARVLRDLREAAGHAGLDNIETVVGKKDDPKLPEGRLDGVLIVNAYHEMDEYEAMLGGIRRALRPDGRLVIIDTPPRDSTVSRRRQTSRHDITIAIVVRELEAAGFRVIDQVPEFARSGRTQQWMLVAVVAEYEGR
ncbi:MAG: methyltransferase domain-containing protein [Gemmatimonadota bacterium]|nr:methyltransferase domain-containing protein [Gemmatimonadota bacterium]MDH3367449.1 methyltransferase domain-containing protein [Gemmatimonadota bacterium]MDH3477733.1 methyltransferase domain-containing protein [Gemmatimonadota bacterium]MDH3569749.1 methyltransferase domain-containing protein [Gemmatimonadota bacterium]MDH5549356.1 methyltransferase domain-containing protein [Gemmatimonadota bacterium]